MAGTRLDEGPGGPTTGFREAIQRLRGRGPFWAIEAAYRRIVTLYWERHYGISTRGNISAVDLGIGNPDCQDYVPTDYVRFRRIMRRAKLHCEEEVFVDYGAGEGRAMIMAATYPFRKVIGVELSERLHRLALANIERATPKLKCKNIEIHRGDATLWTVPSEVTVFYFFNPFHNEVLRRVFDRIRDSVDAAPRKVTIIFLSPGWFEAEVQWKGWLTKADG